MVFIILGQNVYMYKCCPSLACVACLAWERGIPPCQDETKNVPAEYKTKKASCCDQLVDLSIASLLKYYFGIHDDPGRRNINDQRVCIFLNCCFPEDYFLLKIILQN